MRSARPLALALAAALAAGAAAQDSRTDGAPSAPVEASIDLSLASAFEGPSSAPLRLLTDEASVRARVRLTTIATRADGSRAVEARPLSMEIRRRFRLRADGIFSEDRRDELGRASWRAGDARVGPAPWRFALDARGRVLPDGPAMLAAGEAEAVLAARWPIDGWLHPLDDEQPDDAKLRRAARWLELGPGLLGAPPARDARELAAPFEAGESGLTNALVVLVATYRLDEKEGTLAGDLRSLEVRGGSGLEKGRRRPDRWLEIAREENALGPARGRYEARWNASRGAFDHVASELSFELKSRFGEGSKMFPGAVKLERKLTVDIAR